MRFKNPIVASSLVLVFCLPLAAQVALAPLPAPTGARVTLRGAALRAAGALSGRGIEGVAAERRVDAYGRELVWKEVRREVDPEGNIHAFYRQHLAGRGVDAEVYGSEVGAHYSPDGVLRSVSGRQYRNVDVGNEVAFDREAAVEAATLRRPDEMPPDLRARARSAAKLMLVVERRFLGSSGSSEFLGANHTHAEELRGTPRNPEEPNESFADVIAHLVEKRSQSAGSGLERHKSLSFNDLLHKDDTPTLNTNTHSRANRLSVVHRLLAEGGKNPVCSRLPNLSGCGTTVGALGITKANKILFNALQFYIGAYATWDDLADTIADRHRTSRIRQPQSMLLTRRRASTAANSVNMDQ